MEPNLATLLGHSLVGRDFAASITGRIEIRQAASFGRSNRGRIAIWTDSGNFILDDQIIEINRND